MNEVSSHSQRQPIAPGRGLNVLAIAAACAVFPLIFVGAGVTSKDAGMAYADWPTSAGHLVNPPAWWQADDTRWEHGHRLLGWAAGALALSVALVAWRRGGTLRLIAFAALLAIGIQGVLGGLRVTEISRGLAMVHGIWGQICFSLVVAVAIVSGRTWQRSAHTVDHPSSRFLRHLCLAGFCCIFVQLLSGASYRHFGTNSALLIHVLWAMVVTMLVGWIAMWVMGIHSAGRLSVRLGQVIAGLMTLQLLLGGFSFSVKVMGGPWSAWLVWAVPSAHVAVGALLLASMAALTLLTFRLYRYDSQPAIGMGAPQVSGT